MDVLRARGFSALLVGQAVNETGNWVALVAIWGFAAFRFDAGPAELAVLFVVLSVPGALLGPVLGVPIDRLGPRRTLLLANALGAVDALALTQAGSYGTIILLALPLGLVETVSAASIDALPPRLVDDSQLTRANALLGGADNLAVVVGPVLAAAVNVRWGLVGAFTLDALTYLVGVVLALRLPPTPPYRVAVSGAVPPTRTAPVSVVASLADAGPAPTAETGLVASTWRELRDGMAIARRNNGVRWTLGVAGATYLLWSLFGMLEPLYVRDVLGRSDTVFALLQTGFGVGLVSAGLLVAWLGERVASPAWVAAATIASGATAALYVGTESLAVAFVGAFLWGVDIAFFYAPVKTLLQRYAPPAAHGRILSLNQSLESVASLLIAPVVAGVLAGAGVQALGVAGGVAIAVAGVGALRLARDLGPREPTTVAPTSL